MSKKEEISEFRRFYEFMCDEMPNTFRAFLWSIAFVILFGLFQFSL